MKRLLRMAGLSLDDNKAENSGFPCEAEFCRVVFKILHKTSNISLYCSLAADREETQFVGFRRLSKTTDTIN